MYVANPDIISKTNQCCTLIVVLVFYFKHFVEFVINFYKLFRKHFKAFFIRILLTKFYIFTSLTITCSFYTNSIYVGYVPPIFLYLPLLWNY
ncbi:hypothetical protein D3C86_1756650 [compost metagenome]